MKRVIIFILFFLFIIQSSFGQKELADIRLELFDYNSEVFSKLNQNFMDSLQSRFDCEEIDMISVSVTDTADNIHFRLRPTNGYIFNLFDYHDFLDSIEYGFFIEDISVLFLVQENDFMILKRLGHFEHNLCTPFFAFVVNRNNECLSNNKKIKSNVLLESHFRYSQPDGVKMTDFSYIVE